VLYNFQKLDWKLHRLECQALSRLDKDRRKSVTPSIRLMVKLYLRRKLQSEKVKICSSLYLLLLIYNCLLQFGYSYLDTTFPFSPFTMYLSNDKHHNVEPRDAKFWIASRSVSHRPAVTLPLAEPV
jgi:hypothetical protein